MGQNQNAKVVSVNGIPLDDSLRGGRRRRRTKRRKSRKRKSRKKRHKRKTKRRKSRRKRKKRTCRRKRKSRSKTGGDKLEGINCYGVNNAYKPCSANPEVSEFVQQYRQILDIYSVNNMPDDTIYMYVMECSEGRFQGDGHIWIFPDDRPQEFQTFLHPKDANHSCLINDTPTQSAGLISKKQNKISIDACSGHYTPEAENSLGKAYQYLGEKNIIDPNVNPQFNKVSEECGDASPMLTFVLNKAIFNRDGKLKEISDHQPSHGEEEKGPSSVYSAPTPRAFQPSHGEEKMGSSISNAPTPRAFQTSNGEDR